MNLLSPVEKIIAVAAVIALLAGGYYGWREYQRSIGGSEERAKQEKANAEFQVRAAKGAVDYDTCDRAGGVFSFRTGTCQLP